jgi:hypothetical protein
MTVIQINIMSCICFYIFLYSIFVMLYLTSEMMKIQLSWSNWMIKCYRIWGSLCSLSNIHLKFCQLHDNSGCLFVLGFGTRKIFSKYGSSQYVLPLGHTDPPVFSFWNCKHVFGLFTDWLQTHWTNNNLEHERMWIERNIRVGPLVLLDASPFRIMVWN